ncbi:hypothetical protein BH23PLA1_BH23PLA1_34100 [soil metagenome]
MARRRPNEVSLNFDSLTDLVTNLAGGLILLVLLLFITTRGTAIQVRNVSDTNPQASSQTAGLEAEVAALQRLLQQIENERAQRQAEVERLFETASASQPRNSEQPEGQPGPPAIVELRPPMLQETELATGTVFVLTNGRVYFLDIENFSNIYKFTIQHVVESINKSANLKSYQSGILERLRGGDFDVRFTLNREQTELRATLALKAGSRGETVEQAWHPNSSYREQIDQLHPERHFIVFFVYPDSFELFRTVREIILEQNFHYNWTPINAGEELNLGPGRGVVN